MNLKVKKLVPEATLPIKAHDTDAGYDITAINDGEWSKDKTYIEYRTGIALQIPEGYHVELFPRSSISKTDLVLANSLGLVDQCYTGEIILRMKYIPRLDFDGLGHVGWNVPILYKKGERIGQLVIRKTEHLQIQEVQELSETERGAKGFGSSGK